MEMKTASLKLKWRLVALLLLVTVAIYLILQNKTLPAFKATFNIQIPSNLYWPFQSAPCSDPINRLLIGRWEQHPVSEEEKRKSYEYISVLLKQRGIKHGVQRPDKRCGNVSAFPGQPWFRALCHAAGDTPCCFNYTCVNKTTTQCACDTCSDLRTLVLTDHATWRPTDETCQLQALSEDEVCKLLGNATIYFIGDSMMRNKYLAFLMATRGGKQRAAYAEITPKGVFANCRPDGIFLLDNCRNYINYDPVVCKKAVRVKFFLLRGAAVAQKIQDTVLQLANVSRSLVVLGIGIDDKFQAKTIQEQVLSPLLERMKGLKNPSLVWTTPHTPGLTKMVVPGTRQDYSAVREYVKEMKAFLKERDVPVLDTLLLTDGILSHDGTHHGLAVNHVCAQVLLHHIQQVFSKKQSST